MTAWFDVHGVIALLGLILYAIDSHTRRKRRHPSASIAWFVSLLLLPYVAFPLYLFFGRRKIDTTLYADGTEKTVAALKKPSYQPTTGDENLAIALGLPQAVEIQNLTIHHNGMQALQALEACIASAKETLDICTFIFGRDVAGYRISQLLKERAAFLLESVGLTPWLHAPATHLSGGQQQRVAVARGLAMKPALILADEPTGNLDTKSADDVFELLQSVCKEQGTTVLFVTHNPLLSARCEKTIEVVDGQIR